eukprot:TRINITY_DN20738_c0_g1_i1.p2 TRINITY_DN20738_c0_g1~~TRINITY_DN20738_c0_g1_i1.p2  ORF type:complete len:123 (+),score=30.41 TRINITY_DN20738_c0_g1_i1:143-511(+)
MAAAEFVASQLRNASRVTVFSKSYCPFCDRTKALLASLSANFDAIELDQRDDGDAIQDALLELTGGRSVPRVFIGEEFIGGNDDLHALHNKGELEAKLVAARAISTLPLPPGFDAKMKVHDL